MMVSILWAEELSARGKMVQKKNILWMMIVVFLCGCGKSSASTEAVSVQESKEIQDFNYANAVENLELYQEMRQKLLERINNYRLENELNSLQEDTILSFIASYRATENAAANWMETYKDDEGIHHIRPDGSSVIQLYRKYEKYGTYGEILGRRQMSIQEVFHDWQLSDEHNACMLKTDFLSVGIGIAKADNGDFYYAVEFLKENTE